MTRSLARNDRKRDVEDAVPYNGSPYPSAGGRCPHIAPPNKYAFCGGTHGFRPTGYAGHAGRGGGTPSPTGCSSHTGTSGRRPLQRLIAPVRRGRCPHIAPPDNCAFCGGTHGSRPTGYAGHAGRDGGDAVPYNGSPYPSAGGRCPHRPAGQHKEAGASACQLVEKVRMDFFGKLAGKIAK